MTDYYDFATVEDLEAAWRKVDALERPHMVQLISDASTWLNAQLRRGGVDCETVDPALLRMLVCNLVRRSVGELEPVSDVARWRTVTDYSDQYSVPAKVGSDFYLTAWERESVGIGVGRAAFVPLA